MRARCEQVDHGYQESWPMQHLCCRVIGYPEHWAWWSVARTYGDQMDGEATQVFWSNQNTT